MEVPPRHKVILKDVLEANCAHDADGMCVAFADGMQWTWSDAVDIGRRGAAALHGRGVAEGDVVLVFLAEGVDWLTAWFATAFLGAAIVPVHVAHRGDMLRHTCLDSGSRTIITTGELAERVAALGLDLDVISPAQLRVDPVVAAPEPNLELWDIALINYTSGTTGPAKGVLTTHMQSYLSSNAVFGEEAGMTADDRWLVTLPLYHSAGQQLCLAGWSVGAGAALEPSFKASEFWRRLTETGATRAILVGVMGDILMNAPPSDHDRTHRVNYLVSCPMMSDPDGFSERFGITQMVTALGSTEMGGVLRTRPGDPIVPGSCGRARTSVYDVVLVDEHDYPVATGEVGEMVVRPHLPWTSCVGYVGRPADTAAAWRNGWFHSGDLMRVDEAGNFFFVDRRHDVMRRRGENISSYEVETASRSFGAVLDVACVPVRDERGDVEVKIFVIPVGDAPDPDDLLVHLAERLPHFCVPRYIEFVTDLPMTHSGRVQKFELRNRPNDAAWDREVAGWRISSDGLRRVAAAQP